MSLNIPMENTFGDRSPVLAAWRRFTRTGAIEKIMGCPLQKIVNRPITGLFGECNPICRRLDAGQTFSDMELCVRTATGPKAMVASAKPIKDARGRVTGGVVFINPITKIKNLINRFSGAQATFCFTDIIGKSAPLLKATQLAKLAAGNTSNVLLCGESGTGKEIFAQSIHNAGSRRNGPFIAVNCGAIPRELIGSELFGYVDGAFTGARKGGRPGKFELAFTGSTEVGYRIAEAAAQKLIPATLELGGKSANIFFPDCPMKKALEGVQMGILFNQGQVCCAGSRVFVHEAIHDRFVADTVAAFNRVKVGLPWEKDTVMGAQIDQQQLEKILSYVEIGQSEGARLACGGNRITDGDLANGAFMRPTLLMDVDNRMRVAREEIFGPVAVVIKFKTEEEVIAMANDSEYGLGGAVWTRDINRALRVAGAIETGRMWVNNYNNLPAHSPFGGYKKSGIGRETHKVMLSHYTQMKNIFISLSEAPMGLY